MTDSPVEQCMCNNLPHAPHNALAREGELEQQIDASLRKQYAELSRIDQERAKLPAEERQRLEAGDAPLLRIQLLHMLERAKNAEAAIDRVRAELRAVRGDVRGKSPVALAGLREAAARIDAVLPKEQQ
ncbi:hypothetical protein [Streptomyces decoyicus]|uniref:hypothetical protein n=1 Tax=Streptomyces decoyicus TaxID=249567 RepID=UPI00386665C9